MKIKELRQAAGLSQAELADVLHCTIDALFGRDKSTA